MSGKTWWKTVGDGRPARGRPCDRLVADLRVGGVSCGQLVDAPPATRQRVCDTCRRVVL